MFEIQDNPEQVPTRIQGTVIPAQAGIHNTQGKNHYVCILAGGRNGTGKTAGNKRPMDSRCSLPSSVLIGGGNDSH